MSLSSNLIKELMKDNKITLLDIIFNHLKFYDNEFILQLLFHYKNKTAMTTSFLIQQISNEKYKISVNNEYSSRINKYLTNECKKRS